MRWDACTLAIIAIAALAGASAFVGHDGVLLTSAIGAIAGLGGFKAGASTLERQRDGGGGSDNKPSTRSDNTKVNQEE